jgi:hypothetical protein
MFAQWCGDVLLKVLSSFHVLVSGTGRGFETAPLRKHKRCGQLNFDDMRIALIIFFQLTTLSLSAQTLFDIYLMLPEKVGLGDR